MFTCLDHDDGSDYYLDTRNVCVFAGMKNYIGQNKVRATAVLVGALLIYLNLACCVGARSGTAT